MNTFYFAMPGQLLWPHCVCSLLGHIKLIFVSCPEFKKKLGGRSVSLFLFFSPNSFRWFNAERG